MAVVDLVRQATSLSATAIAIAAGALVVIVLFVPAFVSWHRLSHIPGPLGNALSSWWIVRSSVGGEFYLELKKLCDDYGDLVRIAPNAVVSSDPEVLRRISAPKSPYTRGPWYRTFRFMQGIDHVFSMRDEAAHAALKSRLGPGFAGSEHMEACVEGQVVRLLRLMDEKFLSRRREYRPVDAAVLMHYFAMDVIGAVSYGAAFGFLDEGVDIFQYLKWNDRVLVMLVIVSALPWLAKVAHTWPFSLALPKESDTIGLGRFISAAREAVRKRYGAEAQTSSNEKPRSILDHCYVQGIGEEQAVAELVLQIVAGTDSVATATRMTLLYMINTPRVLQRARTELDAALATNKLSRPVIQDAEARQHLPYFQAVLREGLRVFPPATSLGLKTVPTGGDVIAGYHLPAGTQVGMNAYGILHSKRYWGEDADVFRPERWLEFSEEEAHRANEAFDVLFGQGRYKCLGRALAWIEMNKLLPELLLRYDFTVVNPPKPIKLFNSGFFMMNDFWLRVTKRDEYEAVVPVVL